MRLTGVYHTGFTVRNLERSVAFYRDLLGMQLVAERVGDEPYLGAVTGFPGVRIKFAFLAVEGSDHLLELLEYASHPGQPQDPATNRPGNGHLCLKVDDIWGFYERLRRHGVAFVSEPTLITAGMHRGGYAVYLRDPDGFTVELFQPPPQAPS
ncbi:MAG TPA: VOC family protein [Chloroflexota bacterium]